MSERLKDKAHAAMANNTLNGRCDTEGAVKDLIASFDEDDRFRADHDYARRVINGLTRTGRRPAANDTPRQGELKFGLQPSYALDLDGRVIVGVREMSEMEARRALEIRQKQIKADKAKADALAEAISAATPFWRQDPSLQFGPALDLAAETAAEDAA